MTLQADVVSGSITGTGNFDFLSDVHTAIPKFAMVMMSSASAADNNTNDARISVGMYDGTTQGVYCLYGQHFTSLANTNWRRNQAHDAILAETADSTTLVTKGAASFIGGGIRINVSAFSAARVVEVLLIFGDDVTCAVKTVDFSAASAIVHTHGLAAAPNFGIGVMNSDPTGSASSRGSMMIGMWSSTPEYVAVAADRLDNQATEAATGDISTSYFLNNSPDTATVTIGTVGSTTLTLTPSASMGTDRALVAFFNIPNLVAKLGTFAMQAGTAAYNAVTGMAAAPVLGIFLPTRRTTLGSGGTDSDAHFGVGFAAYDGLTITQGGAFTTTDDGATTPVNKSQTSSSAAAKVLGTSGATSGSVQVSAFNSDGIQVTPITATSTAFLVGYALLGQSGAAVAPSIESITTPMVDGSAVTITGSFSASGNAVTVNGVAQTLTTNNATTLAFTCALGSDKYGPKTVIVTNASGLTDTIQNIPLEPASGKAFVNLQGTLVPSGNRPDATPDVVSGDQFELSNAVNCTMSAVVRRPDGSLRLSPTNPALAASVTVRAWDGVWGSTGVFTFGVPTAPSYVSGQKRRGRSRGQRYAGVSRG